jgi:hypothetical protein
VEEKEKDEKQTTTATKKKKVREMKRTKMSHVRSHITKTQTE